MSTGHSAHSAFIAYKESLPPDYAQDSGSTGVGHMRHSAEGVSDSADKPLTGATLEEAIARFQELADFYANQYRTSMWKWLMGKKPFDRDYAAFSLEKSKQANRSLARLVLLRPKFNQGAKQ